MPFEHLHHLVWGHQDPLLCFLGSSQLKNLMEYKTRGSGDTTVNVQTLLETYLNTSL
jgi:hypothetical protein